MSEGLHDIVSCKRLLVSVGWAKGEYGFEVGVRIWHHHLAGIMFRFGISPGPVLLIGIAV